MLEYFVKKKEKPKDSSSPSFEEMLDVLTGDEREELKGLKNTYSSIASVEDSEGSFEINFDELSEKQEKRLSRYHALIGKARNILEKKEN